MDGLRTLVVSGHLSGECCRGARTELSALPSRPRWAPVCCTTAGASARGDSQGLKISGCLRFDGGHRQVLEGVSMFRSLIGFALVCALPASLVLAQVPSGSRLDDVIKSGKLRVCTPGDYKPFSYQRPDGGYEGLDIDLVQSAAKALGVEVEMVKTAWPSLMKDFVEKCDVAVGGISVSTDRQKTAFFTTAYMVNGKAPITN